MHARRKYAPMELRRVANRVKEGVEPDDDEILIRADLRGANPRVERMDGLKNAMVALGCAVLAPLLDRRRQIPSISDGVMAINREIPATLDRPSVVDKEGREMPMRLKCPRDLMVVAH